MYINVFVCGSLESFKCHMMYSQLVGTSMFLKNYVMKENMLESVYMPFEIEKVWIKIY